MKQCYSVWYCEGQCVIQTMAMLISGGSVSSQTKAVIARNGCMHSMEYSVTKDCARSGASGGSVSRSA